jgi:hypothetical protein
MKRLMFLTLFAATLASAQEPSVAYRVTVPMPVSHAAPTVPAHPAHVTLTDLDEVRLTNHPAVEVALGHTHSDDLGKWGLIGHPARGR